MIRTTCIERGLAIAALALALGAPRVAHAQSAEATALFKLGRQLVEQGKWADACPKFDAAFKLDPTARGALLNLADCHEHVGLIAHAWAEWNLLGDLARKAADDARAAEAKKHADALEPRLPKLRVGVAGTQPDLGVWRDDEELKSAEYNLELPIDPGMHTITVKRGDAKLESKNVDMKEKAHESVSFDLDRIAKDHPAPKETPAASGKVVQTNTVVVNGATEPKGPPALKVAANLFLGVGLTAAVFGGAFMAIATGLSADKNTDCTNVPLGSTTWVCKSSSVASNMRLATTLGEVGQWVAIGGGVFVATAIVFYIVAPKDKEKHAPQVSFGPIPGGAAFSLGGAF